MKIEVESIKSLEPGKVYAIQPSPDTPPEILSRLQGELDSISRLHSLEFITLHHSLKLVEIDEVMVEKTKEHGQPDFDLLAHDFVKTIAKTFAEYATTQIESPQADKPKTFREFYSEMNDHDFNPSLVTIIDVLRTVADYMDYIRES